ncbi:hypothetical protein APSETT444_000290 [Aspergillus pseudonomiae]
MDYQERELEKQYFAEVSLTATYRGQRLVDYDTQSDGDDLDKTQRVAALVKNYIKLGILPVKVTEKYRNENYKAPGYIFSKRMPQSDDRHTSISHQSAHNKDDWFENELDWRNSGQ